MTRRCAVPSALSILLAALASATPVPAQEAESPPTCGVTAVGVLCELLGAGTRYDEVVTLAGDLLTRETLNVRDVVALAKSVGVELTPTRALTTELIDLGTPVIVHLKTEPGHFAVLEHLGGEGGVLVEHGETGPHVGVVTLSDFERSFSYIALLPKETVRADAGRLRLPPVRFEKGVSAGWPRDVTLSVRNDGASPFSFEIVGVNCPCLTPSVRGGTRRWLG